MVVGISLLLFLRLGVPVSQLNFKPFLNFEKEAGIVEYRQKHEWGLMGVLLMNSWTSS